MDCLKVQRLDLYYLFYILIIYQKLPSFRITMFADDILITILSTNPQQLNTLANAELQRIDE